MLKVHCEGEQREKNINIINIRMSQKYVEIANLFLREIKTEKGAERILLGYSKNIPNILSKICRKLDFIH